MNPNQTQNIAGMILAGGQSRRFNYQDKSWAILNNQPLIKKIIDQATPQVSVLSISSNCSGMKLRQFEGFNLPILKDDEYPNQGPLSGVLRGLKWAKSVGVEWLATFPVDTPNIPADLVDKLMEKMRQTNRKRIIASDAEREQNILGLWSIELIEGISDELKQGHNKVNRCLQGHPYETVLFEQPFLNINTPTLLQHANRLRDE